MELLREFRKTVTFGGLRVGMEWSRQASTPEMVESLRWLAKGFTRTCLPLRLRLGKNIRCAGMQDYPKLANRYFDLVTDQFVMLGHVFRTANFGASGAADRFVIDESYRHLADAYAAGRGVLVIAPHLIGYPLYPPVQTELTPIPCSIYMRRNRDPRKMRMNEAIGAAGEGHLVYPPEGASKAQRLQVAVDVLREGKCLYITPDTPRKPDQGVPVTLFGKTVFFPVGVWIMAMRTKAPVVPAFWHFEDGKYRIRYGEPIELPRGGKLGAKAEQATQQWAQSVDTFLHEHPEMWWNWLDKRWTKTLRTDPYAGMGA